MFKVFKPNQNMKQNVNSSIICPKLVSVSALLFVNNNVTLRKSLFNVKLIQNNSNDNNNKNIYFEELDELIFSPHS